MMRKHFVFALILLLIVVGRLRGQSFGDSVSLFHYSINLDIINISGKQINGFAELHFTPKVNNLTSLNLDLLALQVDSVVMNNQQLTFSHTGEKLLVNLPTAINPGDTALVTIYYGGQPVMDNSGWGGFYFGTDNLSAFNLGVGFDAVPHNYGRVWYPCIDDFVSRATYDCHIRVKEVSMAVCGGLLYDVDNNGDSTTTYHWRLSTPVPTYIVSVAVGQYVCVSDVYQGIERNIPIDIYVRPQDSVKVPGTFIHLKDALQIFEQSFGPYQWERVGYVGVFFNSGAMEHATNIAYPNACINGGTTYDDLMAHELAHSWFGNLVTCSTAEDMWINEGWASFCEFVFFDGIYGRDYTKDIIRTLHKQVLQMAHVVDGDYWPLYGIPPALTYCRTVYDKGSLVANNLRYHLGDSLFFESTTALLDSFKFKDISSYQMRDFLSAHTQRNLTPFFNNWVFTGGFPQFSTDSVLVAGPVGGSYNTMVYLKQKLNGRTTYSSDNIVELTFVGSGWQFITDTMIVNGEFSNKMFNLPFAPLSVMVNFDEKMCYGAVSFPKVIKQTGSHTFSETHFSANVSAVTDSALVRVTHNFVAPDPLKILNPDIARISDYRYWTVEGVDFDKITATGRFHYNRTTPNTGSLNSNGWLDNTLFSISADSLLLLYRSNAADDWKVQQCTRIGNNMTGYLTVDTLRTGEYTLGIGTPINASLNDAPHDAEPFFKVVPNPSESQFTLLFDALYEGMLYITDVRGALVEEVEIHAGSGTYIWDATPYPQGIYMAVLSEASGRHLMQKMLLLR